MWLRRYLLCYFCAAEDDAQEQEERLTEIHAYTDAQAYHIALGYCAPEDIVSLDCTVRRCSY